MELEWTPPPPPPQQYRKHQQIAEGLRTQPGQWAKVTTCSSTRYAYTVARAIRNGRWAGNRDHENWYSPPGSYDARSDNDGNVYARYVGPNREHAEEEVNP